MLNRRIVMMLIIGSLLLVNLPGVHAVVIRDDFSGNSNLPWGFIDDLGDSPPEFTAVTFNETEQNVQLVGSASDYEDGFDLSLSTTGYVGLDEADYFFEDEVHVTATFSLLENITLGFDDLSQSNNDYYVVARGDGLSGYIFALDPEQAAADLVRVDDGDVVALGDESILRELQGVDQDGTYTLSLSAVDTTLTGRVFDQEMNLLGEVTVEEESYDSGWAGFGAAVNDEGEESLRTLIATTVHDFLASDTLDIEPDPPSIDELTAAILAGSMDPQFDIDQNGTVEASDRVAWVREIGKTYFGDANLDGEFNSGDFVVVFTAGEYEDATEDNSLWAEGDWNGDADFDSSDFVLAFTDGGYELGPVASVRSVPEPGSSSLLMLTTLVLSYRRRRAARN